MTAVAFNPKTLGPAWSAFQSALPVRLAAIHTAEEYDRAVGFMNQLLDEVGDDEDLVAIAEFRECPTDRDARLATDTGVDLVEHEDRWGLGQHAAKRQHRPRQFAVFGYSVRRQAGQARAWQ